MHCKDSCLKFFGQIYRFYQWSDSGKHQLVSVPGFLFDVGVIRVSGFQYLIFFSVVHTLAAIHQKRKHETGLSDAMHIVNNNFSFTAPALLNVKPGRPGVHAHSLARLTWGAEDIRYRHDGIHAVGPGVVPPNVARVSGCSVQLYCKFIAYYMAVCS